jgi:CheY-like chemotaxis protein
MAYLIIVDDDADFAEATAIALRASGHEVAIQLETKGSIAEMERRRPDLIILDVMFPECSSAGFALARRIRLRGEGLKDVPILILSAVNSKFPLGFSSRDIDENWLPVSAFLEKPVDITDLCDKVTELLAQPGAVAG